jgi:hypothetical protein
MKLPRANPTDKARIPGGSRGRSGKAGGFDAKVEAAKRSSLDNPPERQVDSLPDVLFGLGNLVLPELLHRSSHDDQRPMTD